MMNKKFIVIIILISAIFGIILASVYILSQNTDIPKTYGVLDDHSMIIISPSFENNSYIPRKFSCDGENINPELQIQNVPAGAKSLALIVDDPDAPMGIFTHWTVWNIAASSGVSLAPAGRDPIVIKEDSVPAGGTEGKTDFGKTGYGGPCPPSGVHRYHFIIYALSAALDLKSGSDKESLQSEINKHLIAKAELVGLYQRQK